MPDRPRDYRVLALLAAVAVASLAYSLLVVQQILAWFFFAALLGTLYLFWRLIRALERIARALEARDREQ